MQKIKDCLKDELLYQLKDIKIDLAAMDTRLKEIENKSVPYLDLIQFKNLLVKFEKRLAAYESKLFKR